MARTRSEKLSHAYTALVIALGIAVWCAATTYLFVDYSIRDQLAIFGFVLLTIVTGMFPNTFPLPLVLKAAHEKITFTLSDAIVLLVACWYGIPASILIAGIEGFTSSRRTIRRVSSNLFSFGMMSLTGAAAGATLMSMIGLGWHGVSIAHQTPFPTVATGLLVASIVHIVVNTGLFSTFFALRNNYPILRSWRANFLWAAPMFLPTSAAATLMYVALQFDFLMVFVIGAPLLLAIFFGHRQYRNSIQERINSLEKAHREMVEALAVAINAKDEVTHEHVVRVQIYSAGVARILGCSDADVEALKAGALLHDIGKIAVPDYILNKPGKLTASEFEKMKTHTVVGAQILGRVEFPYPVVPVVRHHHERWDGQGYPDGLSGENIPLTARILSVVDCFDAVREDRQYRKGLTRDEAINLIMQGSGTQYDPKVVGTFITNLPQFEAEILAQKEVPVPTFGIEEMEQLSEAARRVKPAAGLAVAEVNDKEKEMEFSLDELKRLYNLAQGLSSVRETDDIVSAFVDRLASIAPYDTCAVSLVRPENGDHQITHAAGIHGGLLAGRKISMGEGVMGWVLVNGKAFCNTDPRLDIPPHLAEHFAPYRTLAVFPIVKNGNGYGTVALYSSTLTEYSEMQQSLLSEAASLLALALSAGQSESTHSTRPEAENEGAGTRFSTRLSSATIGSSSPKLASERTH